MYDFTLARASTLAEAAALAASGAQPLAGGQTLLASMKLRLSAPGQLLDLAGVAELSGIELVNGAIRIGAMTRHVDVAESALVRAHYPALADLASRIGDRQVRARGTIGGSVANNDPAACYPSAVLGSGAIVMTNRREIPADDFFVALFTTALQEGELIKAFRFPPPVRAAYEKVRQSASHFPLIGVFVAKFDRGVRVAVTGAGNGVFRHTGLEDALTRRFHPEVVAPVAVDPAEFSADLHASAAYRANLVRVLTQRAVTTALSQ